MTCQSNSSCLASSDCLAGEYCISSNICQAAGTMFSTMHWYWWLFVVLCRSSSDCAAHPGASVCKETVIGGVKTCQDYNTCHQHCSAAQYCDTANICQHGMLYFVSYQYIPIIAVVCATSSDCSRVPGMPVCKEEISDGLLTCQPSYSCQSTELCGQEEYCSDTHICITQGGYTFL